MALELKTGYLHYQRYLSKIKEIYQKREDVKVYTGLILSLLTISFFGLFAIKPTLSTIASLVKEIKDKREINLKLQEKINALTQAQSELLLISDELYLLDESLPSKPNLAFFINQLEVMAKKNSLKINSLSFSPIVFFGQQEAVKAKKETQEDVDLPSQEKPPQKAESTQAKSLTKPSYQENTFSLQLAGTKTDLRKFLESLENSRRIIKIEKISLTFEKDQNWNLAIGGKIFYL
jgi:Tfp pilus assembly protein PilO